LKRKVFKKITGILFSLIILTVYMLPGVQSVLSLPNEIYIPDGSEKVFEFNLPVNVEISGDSVGVLEINGTSLKEQNEYSLNEPLTITAQAESSADISLSLFGLIKLKDIKIVTSESKSIIPGGIAIGVALYTQGAVVVGMSNINDIDGDSVNPAKSAGLLTGDVITEVNGTEVEDSDQLSELIGELNGEAIKMTVTRESGQKVITVKPVKDSSDGKYRIGVWVRDSTAGVGTLTYYDPGNNTFGGLGHAITDVDTGMLLTVKQGEIVRSRIVGVTKGEEGVPGELHGTFNLAEEKLGKIISNTEFGIYGQAYDTIENELYNTPVLVATHDEVETGPATILCSIDDNGIQEYSCEIIKVNQQSVPSQKGIVIEVTDSRLIEKTGGIVQGMSGSPILQNGKIVGAVTHVFINDPLKGYGMFIEWMLGISS